MILSENMLPNEVATILACKLKSESGRAGTVSACVPAHMFWMKNSDGIALLWLSYV